LTLEVLSQNKTADPSANDQNWGGRHGGQCATRRSLGQGLGIACGFFSGLVR
jgi:hypothetical protein